MGWSTSLKSGSRRTPEVGALSVASPRPQLEYFFGDGEKCCELRVLFPKGFTASVEVLNRTFVAITQAFDPSEVSSLSLLECFSLPRLIWESVLGLLASDNLKEITLFRTLPGQLVAVLKQSEVDPRPPLCSLSHIRISGLLSSDVGDDLAKELSDSILPLAELLATRAGTSFAIQELRISSSSVDQVVYQNLWKLSPPLNLVTEDLAIRL